MTERDIFLSAMEIEDPAERTAHLQEACGGDAELQARVEALLASHESRSRFLNTPVMDQMSGDATMADDATQLSDSTRDADASLEYNGPATLLEDYDMSDEIPLGYLEPASKEGSLGRLGHYEIEEVLGRGAFGTVLKAFDEKLHRVVAIKVLSPQMAATSPARKRFLREARSSAQIRHEHVVAIYGVEEEPIPYLVMEYIPGQTLQQRLDEHGPLDVKDVVRLGKQMADGLAAAHAEGLIHRDIKPGNILLDTSVADRVKITDFGLARTADDASMTQSGLIAGTPMYMAPEQAHGKKLDQRADLFSFGSVLYQMLSGRPPFRAPGTMAVLKRVTEDTPRPIREVIPEVPVWMCEIVGHLHAKDPDQRYGSAKEVSDLLAKCLADVEAGRKPKIPAPVKQAEEPPALVRPTESRLALHRPLAKIAAAILLVVIGLGITEATDVTDFSATVVRLVTGSGTLVIQFNDPEVQVAIDGEEVTIRGAGVEELKLRPGEYNVAALKDGKTVRQELVTITRNGRTVVTLSLESESAETQASQSVSDLRSPTYDLLTSGEFEWTPAQNLGPQIDTEGDKSDPWVSNDGLTLLFTSLRTADAHSDDRDIWQSTRASVDDPWSKAVRLPINSPAWDGLASMSGNGLTMVFVSNRPGGQGHWDLWLTTRASLDDAWATPVSPGTPVNTPEREYFPRISNDGLRLVFTRRKQNAPGETYVTTRSSVHDEWAPPKLLSEYHAGPSQLLDSGRTLLGSENESGAFLARWNSTEERWEDRMLLPLTINNGHEFSKPHFNPATDTLYFEYGPNGPDRRELWMSRRVPSRARLELGEQ